MKNWLIGAVMVVSSGLLVVLLMALGLPRQVAAGIGAAVAVAGFAIQVYTIFSMQASFERSQRKAQQEHEALLKRAQELPPEQAIELLLNSIKQYPPKV